MRRGVVAVITALVIVGCGGDVDRGRADAVASAWVEAVDDRDWPRVCELSAKPEGVSCEKVLPALLGDLRGVALEGLYLSGDDGSMVVSAEAGRLPDDLRVERVDGRWQVHVEVQRVD